MSHFFYNQQNIIKFNNDQQPVVHIVHENVHLPVDNAMVNNLFNFYFIQFPILINNKTIDCIQYNEFSKI